MNVKTTTEWLVLILLFIFGLYTMWVIKNEKKNYEKEGTNINFKFFSMLIPKWWSKIETNNPNIISFQRADTRYEWQANFIWNDVSSNKDLHELFVDHIKERKIIFDSDSSIVYNPNDFKSGELISSGQFEMLRLEGTATEDAQNRLYYDAFLIRNKKTHQYLYAESKSSVLNGLVEGPYFEEVVLRIKILPETDTSH